MHRNLLLVTAAVTVLATLAGCASGGGQATYPPEGELDFPGEWIARYRGPQLEALVDFEFAAKNLGEEWMILHVAFAGNQTAATEVNRDKVHLLLPDGSRLPLPPYQEFTRAYPELKSQARRAVLAASPLGFGRPDRTACELSFQPLPQTAVAREAVHVHLRRICSGFLYFRVPGAVQAGTYRLEVELEEKTVTVPFTLEPA